MSEFEDKYGDLTDEQVEGLKTVAAIYRNPMEVIPRLIESVTAISPTYGNVQYVVDLLSGAALEKEAENG